jgi:hypothetical protein
MARRKEVEIGGAIERFREWPSRVVAENEKKVKNPSSTKMNSDGRKRCVKRRERERVWEEILRRRAGGIDRRRNQLDLEVSNWRKACQIRAYVEEVRRSSNDIDGPIAPGEKGEKWIEWALQQAERIDPLR